MANGYQFGRSRFRYWTWIFQVSFIGKNSSNITEMASQQYSEPIQEENSNISTQEESEQEELEEIMSYSAIFTTFLVDPAVLECHLSKKKKTKQFMQFVQVITAKRKQVLSSFKEIKDVTASLPEFGFSRDEPRKFNMYFNIILVIISTCFALISINGDISQLSQEFFECISSICFEQLRQGCTKTLTSFEEVYLTFIQGLRKVQVTCHQKNSEIRRIANLCVKELRSILRNKYLMCEILFIFYESLLEEINDVSQTVLSTEEKRYVNYITVLINRLQF